MKPGDGSNVYKFCGDKVKQWIKHMRGHSVRRVFDLVSGGTLKQLLFLEHMINPHWSNLTNQSWEEMYNEEFGWNQLEIDQDAFNNSIRDWGTNTILLERVDF